jgi:hypothetical protein
MSMTDIFRDLCAELVELSAPTDSIPQLAERLQKLNELANRTRAALAQQHVSQPYKLPEPEGPTDEELLASVRHFYGDQAAADMGAEDDLRTARAVLARWGTPAPQPVPPAAIVEMVNKLHQINNPGIQPVAPTDEDLQNIFWWECDWQKKMDEEAFKVAARAVLARWGTPAPQPEEGDIHYAWELHDDEGDWQAGGSAITLESVRREGGHYLQIYSQDGPHTLIIQRVSTIEEVTND